MGVEVVDLAKDPVAAGPLARSTPPKSKRDKALAVCGFLRFATGFTPEWRGPRERNGAGHR